MKVNKYCLFLAFIIFFNLQCFYLIDNSILPTSDIAVVLEFLFLLYVYAEGGMKGQSRYRGLMLFPLVLMLTSSFAAYVNYGQPLWYGIRAQRVWIMGMLTYFPISGLLRNEKLQAEQLLRLLDKEISIYILLILLQYVLGNHVIFMHVQNNIRYGTLRLYTSTYFIVLLYFVHLKKILDGEKLELVDLFICVTTIFIHFFVIKSRMRIATLLITTAFAFFSKKISLRKISIVMAGAAALGIFMISPYGQLMFDSFFGNSANDAGTAIREVGRVFYLEKTMENALSFFLGSGYANFDWAPTVAATMYSEGIYYNDNGIIGLFFYYGFSFVVWMLALHIKIMSDARKNKKKDCFLYVLCGLLGIYTLFPHCYVRDISFGLVSALAEDKKTGSESSELPDKGETENE